MKNYPVSRKDNLVVQEMDGEVLIYDLADNKAFCLNETSALVWQACDGKRSTAEISEIISQELNSPANEDLVWFALEQLKKEKLIENSEELPNNFAGMNRREVIKKVGLGTMIALPIISSLVSPVAAQVRSCTGPSGNYTVIKTFGNCNGPAIDALCLSASASQCCNLMSGGAVNCDNPSNIVTCMCGA
jgi:Coenzyme PQQ synthesis protein D (PqqD)